jgi:hypothetical protein
MAEKGAVNAREMCESAAKKMSFRGCGNKCPAVKNPEYEVPSIPEVDVVCKPVASPSPVSFECKASAWFRCKRSLICPSLVPSDNPMPVLKGYPSWKGQYPMSGVSGIYGKVSGSLSKGEGVIDCWVPAPKVISGQSGPQAGRVCAAKVEPGALVYLHGVIGSDITGSYKTEWRGSLCPVSEENKYDSSISFKMPNEKPDAAVLPDDAKLIDKTWDRACVFNIVPSGSPFPSPS